MFFVVLFLHSCGFRGKAPPVAVAPCIEHLTAKIEFCKARRPLSSAVQDGSLVRIVKENGKTYEVAVYHSDRYRFCLPYTYKRIFKKGEKVRLEVLKCGYSNNKPYCPWRVKIGKASWYGYGDGSGKWTASGRPFLPETFGLANKELPFGTLVRITNLFNGKSVIAVVLDRGPYVEGRDFDLYPKTMRAIGGMKWGVVPVKVEVLRCGWEVR